MKVKEIISKCMEEVTVDVYSSTASQFIWGEIDVPEALMARMNNESDVHSLCNLTGVDVRENN